MRFPNPLPPSPFCLAQTHACLVTCRTDGPGLWGRGTAQRRQSRVEAPQAVGEGGALMRTLESVTSGGGGMRPPRPEGGPEHGDPVPKPKRSRKEGPCNTWGLRRGIPVSALGRAPAEPGVESLSPDALSGPFGPVGLVRTPFNRHSTALLRQIHPTALYCSPVQNRKALSKSQNRSFLRNSGFACVSPPPPPWGVLRQTTTHTSALATPPLSATDTKHRQTYSLYLFGSRRA